MSTPTVRRFPRSMSEAFPDERAASVEIHRPASTAIRDVLLAIVIGVGIAAALVAWWSA